MSDNSWITSALNEEKIFEFQLSKSPCKWCICKKCTKHETPPQRIPNEIRNIAINPTNVPKIKDAIEKVDFDDGRLPHAYTCIFEYEYNECVNCKQGRCSEIEIDGVKLKYCYSTIDPNRRGRIPIAFHWDFKVKWDFNKDRDYNLNHNIEILSYTNTNTNIKKKNEQHFKQDRNKSEISNEDNNQNIIKKLEEENAKLWDILNNAKNRKDELENTLCNLLIRNKSEDDINEMTS